MAKEVSKKKVYNIEFIEYTDGSATMNRVNDGFTAVELLGHLEMIQMQIVKQMQGTMKKPTKITRKVVKN
jgi:hypothetical protein